MATNTEENMEPSTSRQSTSEFPRSRTSDQSMPRCQSRSPPPFLTYVHRMETPEAGEDSQEDLVKQPKPSPGCLQAFTNCMKSLWATRHTLESDDRKLRVKTTLKELVVYFLFLVLLSVVAFGMTSTSMYFVTKVISELFLDSSSGGVTFRSVGSVEDTWKVLRGSLPSALHWEHWYNNQPLPAHGDRFVFFENKLLGLPRIRQVKVRNGSCSVHEYFRDVIFDCYGDYSKSNEDTESKDNTGNYTGFTYQSEASLDGSSSEGQLATYSGGGFVQNLGRTKADTQRILEHLFTESWITRGTRAVFVDFTVYNANVNLFCVVRLTVEFPPTGGAVSSWSFRTVKLLRYVTVFEYFIMACEFFFALFIVYYVIEELLEIKIHKLAYFKSVWNILDVTVIVISLVFLSFDIYRSLAVDKQLQELTSSPEKFQDFDFISLWQIRFDNAIAITVFLAWVKLFKYVSFNKTMSQLSSTLARCAKDLAGFAVMYFIVFLAFTQLGYLLFGSKLKEFSDFTSSFFALFNIILGSFDFYALREVDRYLGPTFFMLFIFFIFFILVNMFLAIINDTYSEVKSELATQKDDLKITDYVLTRYRKMLGKIHAREDRVLDLDDVLKYADVNADGVIDFEEWRQDLIKRGYASGEIEALFCKYDADGSRYLDQEEQRRLRQDLESQREEIHKDYDHLNETRNQVSENDDSDNDSSVKRVPGPEPRSGFSGVLYEEYTHLCRRVERMEHAVGGIIGKIDAVLAKLADLEKAKIRRREVIAKILDYLSEGGNKDEINKAKIESMLKQELEHTDFDDSRTPVFRKTERSPSLHQSERSPSFHQSERSPSLHQSERSPSLDLHQSETSPSVGKSPEATSYTEDEDKNVD